jgi:hypothetical protein
MTCITPFLIGIFDSALRIVAVNGNELSGRPTSVTTEMDKLMVYLGLLLLIDIEEYVFSLFETVK